MTMISILLKRCLQICKLALMRSFVFIIAFSFIFYPMLCTAADINMNRIIFDRDGSIEIFYEGEHHTLEEKNVRTVMWFENAPYIELQDNKILKWTTVVSDDSWGLKDTFMPGLVYLKKHYNKKRLWYDTTIHFIESDGTKVYYLRDRTDSPMTSVVDYKIFYIGHNRIIIVFTEDDNVCFLREQKKQAKVLDCQPLY